MTSIHGTICAHCNGTTLCGGAKDGTSNHSPACATCKAKSGLDPQQDYRGVVCSVCGGTGSLRGADADHAEEVERAETPPDNKFTVITTLLLLAGFWVVVTFLAGRGSTGASAALLLSGWLWSGSGGVIGARLFDRKGLHPAFGCLGGGIVGPLLVWLFLLIPSTEKHPTFWAVANWVGLVAGIVGCIVGVAVLVLAITSIPSVKTFWRAREENQERLNQLEAETDAKIKALQKQSGVAGKVVALPPRKAYTRDDFRNLVHNKTKAQVIKEVGPPDETQLLADIEMWYYRGMTLDPLSGRVDVRVQLIFQGGYLTQVNFY